METLVLVDGNSLLHRAYHALPPLTTPDGRPSGAVFGFTSMLLKVIEELKPVYLAVAWDTGAPTFRHQAYVAYKEHRPEMPADLFDQMEMAKQLVEAFNIPQFAVAGYEADDIVGTLAKQSRQVQRQKLKATNNAEIQAIIVTGDLDLLQLVDEKTKVYTPRRGFSDTVLYDREMVKERYGGLEPDQIVDYKALRGDPSDNIPGVKGVGDKTATWLLNQYRTLENIYQHLDQIDKGTRKKLMDGQEQAFLSQRLARIDTSVPIRLNLGEMRLPDYDPRAMMKIFQEFGFRSLVKRLPESDNSASTQEQLFSLKPNDSHRDPGQDYNADQFDLQIAAHLLTGETGSRLSLENLAFNYLGVQISGLSPVRLEGLKYQLREKLEEELSKPGNERIKKLFYQVEMPLKPILREMGRNGILVDRKLLVRLINQYKKNIAQIGEEIYTDVGYEFNLNSTQQLGEVLFDQLGLPVVKRTKTQRSTDETVLAKLLGTHPVIEKILKYRRLAKLKSTYLDPLLGLLDEQSRVHTTFNQTATASGRLSSENPNLQNVPKGDHDNLRRLFVAPSGKQLLVADYSQIELRILAHLSGDNHLIEAFRHHQDVHTATAARIFNKTVNQVTPQERKVGKTINFALMYGMSEYGLATELGIEKPRAKLYIENYFNNYPGVREWQEHHLEEARQKGYVESMFGRRRYLPALTGSNYRRRSAAERIAINHPMQASQADIIKKAMIKINKQLGEKSGGLAKMVLQVHDELVFEVPEDQAEDVANMVKHEMESVVKLSVPIVVDVAVGSNWGEAKELDR